MARSADNRREALQRGAEAESFVADELVRLGWTILDRNWRGGGGELDLVVERDGDVRFVEVKSRADDLQDPLEAVDAGKQRKLVRAAEAWLLDHPVAGEACFLVVVVSTNESWQAQFYDNAFDVD